MKPQKTNTLETVAVIAAGVSLLLVVATAAAPADMKAPLGIAGAVVAFAPATYFAARDLLRTSRRR